MNRPRWIRLTLCAVTLTVLAGCAPAATRPPESATPAAVATQLPGATEAPAVAETGAPNPTAAGAVSTATNAGQSDLLTATPAPTQAVAATLPVAATGQVVTIVPLPTAAPTTLPAFAEEPRVIELEYPVNLRLASSSDVRLSLVPDDESYQLVTEQPDGTVVTQTVTIPQPEGYGVFAGAQLFGVNFDIAPHDEQFLRVNPGETLTWRWSVRSQSAGDHTLTVNLRLRLISANDTREAQLFSRALPVRVWPLPGPTWLYMGLGVLGLVTGGAVSLGALVWRGRRGPQPRRPNTGLQLDLPAGLQVEREDAQLLRTVFGDYQRLIVEREFRSGYSGARALLALPIKADGRADAHTIVKIGPSIDIEREHLNYERFVKNTLPPVTARMQDTPLRLNGRAALRYTFIAEAGQAPISLRQALRRNPDPTLLWRLFESFAPTWWSQTRPIAFRLAAEYDRVLPPHLVVRPTGRAEAGGAALTPESDPAAFARGQAVRVSRFPVAHPRADGRSLALSAAPGDGRAPLRVSWLSPQAPNGGPTSAEVVATRSDYLRDRVAGVDLFGLPDPITRLPEFLEATIVGGSSIIHGDLNLENALVGPGGLVWLIDFSETREGHVLYDFARLGAELIAHVLAPAAGEAAPFLEAWRRDQVDAQTLTGALFAIPQRLRSDAQTTGEFELCLLVACLGALKHDNLDAQARACLYLAAADLAARRP
ncbi:MAG: phosphotransferase [Anaerolineales bacterium]|nr:phosphotransferase [Anaerolineales bacterium]